MGHGARFAVIQGYPRGPTIGYLKSLCRTSYWASVETIALNCLFLKKNRVSGDRRTDVTDR